MEQEFKIRIDAKAIREQINASIQHKITTQLNAQEQDIEKSIKDFFYKGFHSITRNAFENSLDYVIEGALRQGLEKAMEELGFHEMIAEKAKTYLQDDDILRELAEGKVRASLGLPQK